MDYHCCAYTVRWHVYVNVTWWLWNAGLTISIASIESFFATAQIPTAKTLKFPQAKELGRLIVPLYSKNTHGRSHRESASETRLWCLCENECVFQERREIPQVCSGERPADILTTLLTASAPELWPVTESKPQVLKRNIQITINAKKMELISWKRFENEWNEK